MTSIIVRGCMGVGKSTFCGELAKHLNLPHYKEQAENNLLLKLAYQDKEYFFGAQLEIMVQQFSVLQNHKGVFEAGVEETAWVYPQLSLRDDQIDLLIKNYNMLSAKLPKVDLDIYLRANPEVIYNRVVGRNREIEETVNKSYIFNLFNNFERLWRNLKASESSKSYLELDWDEFPCGEKKDSIMESIREKVNLPK